MNKIILISIIGILVLSGFEIVVCSEPPPEQPIIDGPSWGIINISYTFCFTWTDPDADDFYCIWYWGDGSNSEWQGPYSASQTICASHSWSQKGTYEIYVRIKDIDGVEIISEPHIFNVYELKKAFIFGRFTNLTKEGEYISIQAFNLWIIFFKPLQFLHYNNSETIMLFNDTNRLMIINQLIIGLTDLLT